MDVSFRAHQTKPGDDGFVYDVLWMKLALWRFRFEAVHSVAGLRCVWNFLKEIKPTIGILQHGCQQSIRAVVNQSV